MKTDSENITVLLVNSEHLLKDFETHVENDKEKFTQIESQISTLNKSHNDLNISFIKFTAKVQMLGYVAIGAIPILTPIFEKIVDKFF